MEILSAIFSFLLLNLQWSMTKAWFSFFCSLSKSMLADCDVTLNFFSTTSVNTQNSQCHFIQVILAPHGLEEIAPLGVFMTRTMPFLLKLHNPIISVMIETLNSLVTDSVAISVTSVNSVTSTYVQIFS